MFHEVKEYTNWCHLDQIDGKNIKDGEKLELIWPDGHTMLCNVIVEGGHKEVLDMNSTYLCPISYAFAMIEHHGSELKIRLADVKGLKARRV
jgi:hypothetical protein